MADAPLSISAGVRMWWSQLTTHKGAFCLLSWVPHLRGKVMTQGQRLLRLSSKVSAYGTLIVAVSDLRYRASG